MNTAAAAFHYNPDWLSDDDLIANFVARLDLFNFLRGELARAPRQGSAQHYLLVGLRGAGKTTLLKRLAVAIRRDDDIRDHLIALSFPEELYQVKNLADFWWAACDALADELDRQGKSAEADRLADAVEAATRRGAKAEGLDDAGLKLLLQTCAALERRPVLLVDNLDLVFQRIDKSGRKLKDPHAPAYWALREALSTTTSPIVIGGSVRLSEPFTDYDKAFYDFFLPKRLAKLSFDEVRQVLERLADAQNVPEVKDRLHARPARVEALYELTGGNPRALGLIFELLRQGANSRAVEDFERLMDATTPYYKARFEELSEQAQVVTHALAVRRPSDGSGLRFGHTAAEIAAHAGLPTSTVSAQMDVLEREGLVEKSAAHGRTQYRIAEQLFRLWLQMRANRRIRQNVIGLTEFLEAMFDLDELQASAQQDGFALADAKLSFAIAGACCPDALRRGMEARGADRLLEHLHDRGGELGDYLPSDDLPEDLAAVVRMREQLQKCDGGSLTPAEQDALLGSLELSLERKQAFVQALCTPVSANEELVRLRSHFNAEHDLLLRKGLRSDDLPTLFSKRAKGYLPLPNLTPEDAEIAFPNDRDNSFRAMVWRLVGARDEVKFADDAIAQQWLEWGLKHIAQAGPDEWAAVAGAMRRSERFGQAQLALDQAFSLGESAQAWFEQGMLKLSMNADMEFAEAAFRQAIQLDPTNSLPWNALGNVLSSKLSRREEAEAAYREAIKLDQDYALSWCGLGSVLMRQNRNDEAEEAFRKAIELESTYPVAWIGLGGVLMISYHFDEAKAALQKAINLDPVQPLAWSGLGDILMFTGFFDEAETAFRTAIEITPTFGVAWCHLGVLLETIGRLDEALEAYVEGTKLDENLPANWRERGANLQTRLHSTAARQALEAGDIPKLREVLSRLLAETEDLPVALVSEYFVEGFLAPALVNAPNATMLPDLLREMGFEKHARPLLLAFEAALEQRPERLADLEPEIQGAARHMYERLTAKPKDGKKAKRAAKKRSSKKEA